MITGALIAAGGTLLTADSGGGSEIYEVNGRKVDASECWQDGSGPCANGKYIFSHF